ncbi:voltage-dependent calcium channel subunit alpha-2/delta-3-like [Arctopsyche grandis]|uniref:voltage-dependent calcium channel subunit alpha-2/delta-3-like n=1 Tax=Arctopsyche grandis TaxID=121162 RepID=UPI00406D947C
MCRRVDSLAAFLFISSLCISSQNAQIIPPDLSIDYNLVHSWAQGFGLELRNIGEQITRRKEVQNSFRGAHVELRNGKQLVQEIVSNLRYMMKTKVAALKKIVEAAESIVSNLTSHDPPLNHTFYSSKGDQDLRPLDYPTAIIPNMTLTKDPYFDNKLVNTQYSSIHVPTDVFDWSNNTLRAIWWSEKLDKTFIKNFEQDLTLSWQYFGSASGIMRHYPAMQWDADPVDLYDCRTRAWYIEAAVSPKDMVIIVDMSGSMTGTGVEVARQIVYNILDTLGNNDFVNVFTMINNTIFDVVTCFSDTLIQANLANVRELKLGLDALKPHGIANFPKALIKSFDILQRFRNNTLEGAGCNQAIMLISDGIYDNHYDIFKSYNLQNLSNIPVRVFTYSIGIEEDDMREEIWIACANQGYFVRLINVAEARKQVLQYVPVMSRPLALYGDDHPVSWTQVYANMIDPKMTDYLWEEKQHKDQMNLIKTYRQNKILFKTRKEREKRRSKTLKEHADQYGEAKPYMLMTSVSMPVFNKTKNDTLSWNLLGVAGVDVPIDDIKRLMMPHQLGVNGYAFIITNNGYVLIHPDFRPVFQGILKPGYNTVDMLEVELMDDDTGPRQFHDDIIHFRNEILNQENGSVWMQVKYHYDNMTRVSRIRRQYYWTEIPGTVFSLVVALPEPYGLKRIKVKTDEEFHYWTHSKSTNLMQFFKNPRFQIHPEWLYCRDYNITFSSPKEHLLYFLEKMNQQKQKWKWPNKSHDSNFVHCDKNLMKALICDARNTAWFYQDINNTIEGKIKIDQLIYKYGITLAFMATHSGLTRWIQFLHIQSTDSNYLHSQDFGEKYPRSIDEIWYKRAVEQHVVDPQSYVYSVDLDAGEIIDEKGPVPFVLASHAIFRTEDQLAAPIAVVGYQFHHSSLHSLFHNITSVCENDEDCTTCKSDELECYVLDNNAYILVTKSPKNTGKFFGELEPKIMQYLLDERVYKKVHIPDYQAVCFEEEDTPNRAPSFLTPLIYFGDTLKYIITYILWICQQFSLIASETAYSYIYFEENESDPIEKDEEITTRAPRRRKKKLTDKEKDKIEEELLLKWATITIYSASPCDHEVWLYQLQENPNKLDAYKKRASCESRPFVVQPIPASNLIMVIINNNCNMNDVAPILAKPTPVSHNDSLACIRMKTKGLDRKPLPSCRRHHPNEVQIKACGRGSNFSRIEIIHLLCSLLVTALVKISMS